MLSRFRFAHDRSDVDYILGIPVSPVFVSYDIVVPDYLSPALRPTTLRFSSYYYEKSIASDNICRL